MSSSYAALCTDHYVNQRLNLKMDLSLRRDTVLNLFDRIKREHPHMDRLRRYPTEFALETTPEAFGGPQQWVAVRRTSIRSGVANPEGQAQAAGLHRLLLELAPYYLDVTALDVEHVEMLFGFDLHAGGNHDAIVCRALMAGSAVASMMDRPGAVAVECQPMIGVCLDESAQHQAFLEVKTRSSPGSSSKRGPARMFEDQESPISVYLIMRRLGPLGDIAKLPSLVDELTEQAEELIEQVVVPNVLSPLRSCIAAG